MGCEEALPLIRQMAEGLAAAHKEHLLHATSSRATSAPPSLLGDRLLAACTVLAEKR
jgi:hypothetical protein